MLGILPFLGAMFGGGRGKSDGSDDPLTAQKEFALQQAWTNARTAMDKMENDGKSAKANGITDSYSKQINAMIESSKAIRF
ncbi:hypothetical protein [Pseudomonas fragi]|uniref:Uncharacterized protein n=1 Tax=Pseudomonas fragi TaxID=296 RepID=A0A9Q6YF86_PSEFR|nr:hypothetical protein [Pseudomonas fragi]QPL32501.1 hypothetical protein I5R27_05190 [Pseudomonas fragi]